MLIPKNQLGRYRANPDAVNTNALRLVDNCGCGDNVACTDDFTGTVTSTRTIKSVTYDGVVYATETGVLPKADLQAFIQGVVDGKEVDALVEVTYVGTTLTVKHIGEGTLSVITYDNDSTSTLTRCCNLFNLYAYGPLDVVGTVGDLQWGGGTAALANNPYAWSGTPATDTATAAQLQTDLDTAMTALGVPNATAVVTKNDTDSEYTITITNTSNEPILIGTTYLASSGNTQEFICA